MVEVLDLVLEVADLAGPNPPANIRVAHEKVDVFRALSHGKRGQLPPALDGARLLVAPQTLAGPFDKQGRGTPVEDWEWLIAVHLRWHIDPLPFVPLLRARGFERERHRHHLACGARLRTGCLDPRGPVALELTQEVAEVEVDREVEDDGVELAGGVAIEKGDDGRTLRDGAGGEAQTGAEREGETETSAPWALHR